MLGFLKNIDYRHVNPRISGILYINEKYEVPQQQHTKSMVSQLAKER